MAITTMVHVRVDEQIKTQAAETLAAMGLTVSDAIRVFLTLVVAEKQLPFALKVPNTDTSQGRTRMGNDGSYERKIDERGDKPGKAAQPLKLAQDSTATTLRL
jgi:DNA-damage-inducible protein J